MVTVNLTHQYFHSLNEELYSLITLEQILKMSIFGTPKVVIVEDNVSLAEVYKTRLEII